MKQYRAVFIDAGGTLIHLDRRFILDQLARFGVQKDEAAFIVAEAAARDARAVALRSGQQLDDAASWRIYAARLLEVLECTGEAAQGVMDAVRQRSRDGLLWTHVEEGTAETLAALRQAGLILGVVSNADGRVDRFLETVGLRNYFEFVVDSGLAGVEKPDPRIFEIAMQQAGTGPDETVHVGDTYEVDVLGARAAGLDAILLAAHGAAVQDVPTITAFRELGTLLLDSNLQIK